jgi:hypothetical protein
MTYHSSSRTLELPFLLQSDQSTRKTNELDLLELAVSFPTLKNEFHTNIYILTFGSTRTIVSLQPIQSNGLSFLSSDKNSRLLSCLSAHCFRTCTIENLEIIPVQVLGPVVLLA